MAITKTTEDTITILSTGVFEHLRKTRVYEDGELLGERNHRTTYTPDMDPTTLPNKIAKIANVVWTAQVIADWNANALQAEISATVRPA